ncbi:MAG: porin family protein [Flavobacteriales bacterium]|nr:porin family protein [Flavobacteriales bacterium]
MKKQLFMFFAAALMTSGLVAQDLKFGALAGLNVNIITENVDPEPDGYESSTTSGFGFHLGGFGEYAISESIGIRAELQIQQRGVTDEIEFITTDENLELTTTMVDYKQSDLFVQIPILVAINAGESLSFHVGPTLGFLASANAEFDGEEVENADEGRNGFELGLALGAQYNLNENMGLGLRYTRGLTDLAEDNEFGGTTFNTNYNVVQLYFSYAFGG